MDVLISRVWVVYREHPAAWNRRLFWRLALGGLVHGSTMRGAWYKAMLQHLLIRREAYLLMRREAYLLMRTGRLLMLKQTIEANLARELGCT